MRALLATPTLNFAMQRLAVSPTVRTQISSSSSSSHGTVRTSPTSRTSQFLRTGKDTVVTIMFFGPPLNEMCGTINVCMQTSMLCTDLGLLHLITDQNGCTCGTDLPCCHGSFTNGDMSSYSVIRGAVCAFLCTDRLDALSLESLRASLTPSKCERFDFFLCSWSSFGRPTSCTQLLPGISVKVYLVNLCVALQVRLSGELVMGFCLKVATPSELFLWLPTKSEMLTLTACRLYSAAARAQSMDRNSTPCGRREGCNGGGGLSSLRPRALAICIPRLCTSLFSSLQGFPQTRKAVRWRTKSLLSMRDRL